MLTNVPKLLYQPLSTNEFTQSTLNVFINNLVTMFLIFSLWSQHYGEAKRHHTHTHTNRTASSCRSLFPPRHAFCPIIIHLFLHLGINFGFDGRQPTLDRFLCRAKERITAFSSLTTSTGRRAGGRFLAATINVSRVSLLGTVHGRWHLRHEFHVEFIVFNHIFWTMEANHVRRSTLIPNLGQGDPKLRRKAIY